MEKARPFRALAATVILALGSLSLRPTEMLVGRPLSEDGFYLLSVARNIALGRGGTIDGVHPTSGFQPLFAALCVPAYLLTAGSRIQALRIVIGLELALFVLAAWLFARLVRDAFSGAQWPRVFELAFFTYLGSMLLFWQHMNGLETGLVLVLYLTVGQSFQRRGFSARLGLLLGFLVLARVDAVFMVAALGGAALVTRWHGSNLIAKMRAAAITCGLALLVSSPWWLYNRLRFGTFMPSSGAAQQQLGIFGYRVMPALYGFAVNASPMLYFGGAPNTKAMLSYSLVAALTLFFFFSFGRSAIQSSDECQRSLARFGAALSVSMLALAAWYFFSSFATYFYVRYFSPLALFALFSIAMGLAGLGRRFPKIAPLIAPVVCVPVVLLAAAMWSGRPFTESVFYREQLGLVRAHVPEDAKVAAYQSGTLGYFRDQVVNLDGKVNRDALRHQDDMAKYVADHAIDWICDWPSLTDRIVAHEPRSWTLVAETPQFRLYHRIPEK